MQCGAQGGMPVRLAPRAHSALETRGRMVFVNHTLLGMTYQWYPLCCGLIAGHYLLYLQVKPQIKYW